MDIILITGINGFLGSHLAKRLCQNYNVIGLEHSIDNLYRLKGYKFPIFLSDEKSINKIFDDYNIEIIIHAATIYRRYDENIIDLINTNIVLPIRLYELAKKNGTKLFINTDSFFNNEGSQYKYLGEYILSKRHVIEWLKKISSGTKLINMKLFHMYGEEDSQNKFIPYMINQLRVNNISIDLTLGEQTRDFIYIDDVISAYECVIKNLSKISESFSEFEVGTGIQTSIRDFMEMLKKYTKSTVVLNFGALPYREHEIMNSRANNKELVKLGWQPTFTLEKGIKKLLHSIN